MIQCNKYVISKLPQLQYLPTEGGYLHLKKSLMSSGNHLVVHTCQLSRFNWNCPDLSFKTSKNRGIRFSEEIKKHFLLISDFIRLAGMGGMRLPTLPSGAH